MRPREDLPAEVNSVKIGDYEVAAVHAAADRPLAITQDADRQVNADAQIPAFLNRDRRYLYVIGPSVPEVVGRVGGWMFDRAMAGWDVTVFLPDLRDIRPLRILGAQATGYGSAVQSVEHCPGYKALAVAAQVYDNDASVRSLIRKTLDKGSCEVTIWGAVGSADLGAHPPKASHQLSPAAAAFKKHALEAATALPAPDTTGSEVFYSNSVHLTQLTMVHPNAHSITTLVEER